jgi:hypothetical protein
MDYDPNIDIYKERAKMRKAKAKGIERFAYEILGADLIATTALALDVLNKRPEKFPNDRVSKVTRVRNVSGVPAATRTGYRVQVNRSHSTFTPFDPFYGAFSASPDNEIVVDGRGSIALNAQEPLLGYIKDTSSRTRPHGVQQGEMELFTPRFQSDHGMNVRRQHSNLIITNFPGSFYETTKTWEDVRYGFLSDSFRVTVDGYRSFVSSYINSVDELLRTEAVDLVANTLPSRRRYTLARNLVELKDLPKLLRDSLKQFQSVFTFLRKEGIRPQDVYLTYLFGWRQLVSDIRDLIRAPELIAKELNFYISRQGRPTTLRGFKKVSRVLAFHPDFETEVFNLFDEPPISSSQEVKSSDSGRVTMALNCNIAFPRVDIPALENFSRVLEKLGTELTPVDIYDVIPWTWLTDWFTGASDYFHLLEQLANDPSIINYGTISFKGRGNSFCQYVSEVDKSDAVVESVPYSYTASNTHFTAVRTADFSWRTHVRRDLTTVVDSLKTTSGKGLSSYQLSIVTALAAQRAGKYPKRRRRQVKP